MRTLALLASAATLATAVACLYHGHGHAFDALVQTSCVCFYTAVGGVYVGALVAAFFVDCALLEWRGKVA